MDGRVVLLAPTRGERPGALRRTTPHDPTADRDRCPFCPGREHETEPTEVSDADPWTARVFRNRFPAVSSTPPAVEPAVGLTQTAALGLHDVLVPSPIHDRRWSALTDDERQATAAVLATRMAAHRQAGAYTQLLVNWGRGAGASIAHLHAQLITVPIVPEPIRAESTTLRGDVCVLCEHLRIHRPAFEVTQVDGWTITSPPWGATPYELLLTSDDHRSRTTSDASSVATLLTCVSVAVETLERHLGDVDFNMVLHEAPHRADDFHAHVHIWPVLVNTSGFERGTGIHINVVDPQVAATQLSHHHGRVN